LRVSGAGEAGRRKGENGDLFVGVHVSPHPHFERENEDLIYKAVLTFPQAALGCEIEVPAVGGGKNTLKIPEGAHHGASFRISGQGMPKLGQKRRGDVIVRVELSVPKHLSQKQKELLRQFSDETRAEEEKGGFFKKVFG
ncbi:MAG: molecular chaperone DnaJ, partial [Elusimicrobia bacterium]|nr:molecular chaperone DnaJ [Elusimicrobiota bacterium]